MYCAQAPEYYDEIQAHIQAQGIAMEQQTKQGSASGGEGVWWDIGGWVLLSAVIVGALVVARSSSKAA